MSITDQLEAALPDESLGPPVAKAPKKSIWQFELTAKKVSRKELMHFSRQLAVFIKAGIPIIDALEVIQEEMTDKHFTEILSAITSDLRSGSTFSDAASLHERAFPAYYLGMLRSAEVTGRLDSVLDQLSGYIERDLEARRRISSAMAYPAVIMATSLVVVVILVAFVLPKFERFFADLNAKLPLPTRMLLNASKFLTDSWLPVLAILGFLVISTAFTFRTQKGRLAMDTFAHRLPVIGDLQQHVALERFCRIFGAMMRAGVTLPTALRITTEAITNHAYRRELEVARESMIRGEGLAGPLAQTGMFPAAARQMLRVGESTGTLDQQLQTAADYYERELDYKIKRFTSLFEPMVLLFVGLVVGFVAVALVSAMYGIFGQTSLIQR